MFLLRWHDLKADFKAASHVSFADNDIPECIATSLVKNVSKMDIQTINIHILMLDIIFLNRAFIIINVTIIKQYTDCSCSIEKSNNDYIMQVDTTLLGLNSSADTYTKFDITHNSYSLCAYIDPNLVRTNSSNKLDYISYKNSYFTQYLSAVVSFLWQCWIALCSLCDILYIKCFK